ncbi:M18 family aminopeptidase [Marinobacteraceae bacterium S3BR75-40.1]
MELAHFNQELMAFLRKSPTPYHAVANMAAALEQAGFQALDEREGWQLADNQGYYVVRNGASIVAFRTGDTGSVKQGIRMAGAHTDSPCLRVKPNPEVCDKGYFQLGVEVYGGALLNPWFDRDLSMAGRVAYINRAGDMAEALVDFERPVAVIPSLAIHLDREANNARSINPQTDLPPLLLLTDKQERPDFRELLRQQLTAQQPELDVKKVLDYELSLYDTQPPALVGVNEDFITSARLDNLLSCFIGLQALLKAERDQPALLVCNDHEEVGSMSAEGAQGPFLSSVVRRWVGEARADRVLAQSMMISADNAHALHPNYKDRHDANHGPLINQGPVIKINNNQRYATSSRTAGIYRYISEELGVPCQSFVVRSDMACGSTIGPLTAGTLGVQTLDIGVPQMAMHSIRELAGTRDAHTLYRVLRHYFALDKLGL